MNFNKFFPTIIADITNLEHDKFEKILTEHCIKIKQSIKSGGQGWLSNKTYNTSDGKYDILKDKEFDILNIWINKQIIRYCNELNIDTDTLKNNGSWFNIYSKYDFQETHVHPTSSISAIYILTCPDNGSKIFFNSPINNMFYIKKTVEKQEMIDQLVCKSIPGTLLIFPSYLPHAVERHESDNIRITISYNYKNG